MSEYGTWEYEKSAMLNAVAESDRERVGELLDRAAGAAQRTDLSEAARLLEQLRLQLVSNNLFRSWDNGIWCFSSLFRLIRDMSHEPETPKEFRRFLDAIPSAHLDAKMSRTQRLFWYGPDTD